MQYAALVVRLRTAGCVFAEEEARLLLAEASGAALEDLVARRVAGEPLEQVLGWAEFRGLRLAVAPGVFVPRTRTGFLVERALALSPDRPVVLDLCCGVGAIGAAFASVRPCTLVAADVDPVAVECARRNLAPYGGEVVCGDLLDPVPTSCRGRVDLLLANTPYVPSDRVALMPPEARDHERLAALDGGADGLDLLRRVAASAPDWLAPGGHLLVEIASVQGPAAVAAYEAAGLEAWVEEDDDYGAALAIGRLSPGAPRSGP